MDVFRSLVRLVQSGCLLISETHMPCVLVGTRLLLSPT
jgi:hypothetical protein